MNQVILEARAIANFKEVVTQVGGQFSIEQLELFAATIVKLDLQKEEGADVAYINELIVKLS